jgi:hypothetical protein
VYLANPYYFGKGAWSNISKIRMTIEYDANSNRKLLTEIERSNMFNKESL